MAFAEWAQNNEISFNNVWFSDEAHLHLDGVVNKQNVRFWACDSWEGASCTENYSVGRHLKSWTARTNFLWRDSEQWVPFNHVAQYFCASPSCYMFTVTNSVGHAGWSQAAHSECCFGLSAWHFRLARHLKPISLSFRMWTELAPQ
jgi:hypothetical protein